MSQRPAGSGPEALLYPLAVFWPLGAYGWLPGVEISALALLGALLIPAALYGVLRHGKPPLPFELWWPAAALAFLAALPGAAASWEWIGFAALFLGGLALIRSAEQLERCLDLALGGAALLALLHLAAHAFPLLPAALDPASGARAAAHASTLREAAALVSCAGLGWGLTFWPLRPGARFQRSLHALLALLLSAAAASALGPVIAHGIEPRPAGAWLSLELAPSLLAGWLVARIAAKLWFAPHESAARMRPPLLLFLAASAALPALLGAAPPAAIAIPLALAARAGLRFEGGTAPWGATAALLAACVVVALNLVALPLERAADPRNIKHRARTLFEAGSHDALADWSRALGEQAPNARAALWEARSQLATGAHAAAADAFAQAKRLDASPPRTWPSVPGLTPAESAAFLDRLRDAVSALPPESRGLSYERALVAAGQREQALAALRFRVAGANEAGDFDGREAMAGAIARALGDPGLAGEFAAWPAGALRELARQTGIGSVQ